MEASRARADWKPARPKCQLPLVQTTLPGLVRGGGVASDTGVTRVSPCANIGASRRLWADRRRTENRWSSCTISPADVQALGGSMCLGDPTRPKLHETAQVKGGVTVASSRRSVTTSQRTHLRMSYTKPASRFSSSKVLAGCGARRINNHGVATALRLNGPRSGDRCDLGVWQIPVLTRAIVVYRLARESTGIDLTVGSNTGPAG
jgi:hypothetical protein